MTVFMKVWLESPYYLSPSSSDILRHLLQRRLIKPIIIDIEARAPVVRLDAADVVARVLAHVGTLKHQEYSDWMGWVGDELPR